MYRRERSFLLFPLLLSLWLFLNCGSRHDADEKYVLVTANLQVPYWKTASAGFLQEASLRKVHASVVGPDTYDAKAEQDELRHAIQQKPMGILISVADPKLLTDDINRAVAAGIPVLTIDSDAPASKRLFFIGTNNYLAGLMGGERLAKELQNKGNVVVFTMPEQSNLDDRLRGYRAALEAHPQIKITQVIDIKGDPRVAFDSTEQLLGKKDMVNAFVCLEAQAGKEVASVLNNHGIKDKVVMAMDTDPDTLQWIHKGVIAATISQKPYTMANFGLRLLDDLYHEKPPSVDSDWAANSLAPVPAFVDTGSSLIDRSSVDAFIAANKALANTTK